MRKALNENPVVQISVVGVLLVLAGIFIVSQMGGGGGGSSGTSTSAAAPAPGTTPPATGSATSAPAGTASPTSVSPTASAASASSNAPAVSPAALVAGPGLPKPVLVDYQRGKVVVLLFVRNGGVDDKLVQGSVESLRAEDVSVFVAKASQVARYARITEGVGVSQVPALVVVRPRSSGSAVPEATVTYGFTTSQGVVQAAHDALYKGPDDLPYDPRG